MGMDDFRAQIAKRSQLKATGAGGQRLTSKTSYRNSLPAISSTAMTSTRGTKRLREDDLDTRSRKSVQTFGPGPSKLRRQVDSGVTMESAVAGLFAAELSDTGPSIRPFPFTTSTVNSRAYHDLAQAMTTAPTRPELLPPSNALALPTALDPKAIAFSQFYSKLIVSVPWFEIAMNPNASPSFDQNFVYTQHGVVCAKRRMAIVLRTIGDQSFFALPITSHTQKCLRSIDKENLKYHICLEMWNEDRGFVNQPPAHEPLMVTKMAKGSMGLNSSINLCAAGTVPHGVKIRYVGYLSSDSTARLIEKFDAVQLEAKMAGLKAKGQITPVQA